MAYTSHVVSTKLHAGKGEAKGGNRPPLGDEVN